MNDTLLRINLLCEFLSEVERVKKLLLDELIDNATDPVIRMRRFRMLQNLAQMESDMIQKISAFQSDNLEEWQDKTPFTDISAVVNRSA